MMQQAAITAAHDDAITARLIGELAAENERAGEARTLLTWIAEPPLYGLGFLDHEPPRPTTSRRHAYERFRNP